MKCNNEKCNCEVILELSSKKEIDILIVGSIPTDNDIKNQRPLSGKTSDILRNSLLRLKKHYDFTYAITSMYKSTTKKAACLEQLDKEIEKYKPKVIVCYGKSVYTHIFSDVYYKDFFLLEEGCVRYSKKYNTHIIGCVTGKWCIDNDPCSAGFIYMALQKAILHLQGVNFNISDEFKYEIISTVEQLRSVLIDMKNTKAKVGVDTETTSLNRVYNQTVLSIQLCNNGKVGFVIPYKHFDSPFTNDDLSVINELLIDFFTGDTKVTGYIFQNAKFDLHQLFRELHVLLFNAPIIDTMFNEFILEENWSRMMGYFPKGQGAYSLATLSYKRGFTGYLEEEMNKKNRDKLKDIPIKKWAKYAAADSVVVWNIWKSQCLMAKHQNYIKQFKKMALVYNTHLTRVLVYIEHCGMPVNMEILRELSNPRVSKLIEIIKDITKKFSHSKNVQKVEELIRIQETGSNKTLFGTPSLFDPNKKSHQELLYTKVLKLEPLNSNGKTSINDEFQKTYKDVYEVGLHTQWNKIQKLKTGYIDNIMNFMNHETGESDFYNDNRIRSSYMFDAVTGRLKSRSPNSQQRPSRGENIGFVLSMFEASKNKILVKLDYSTFEVRGLAFISHDKKLSNSFIEMHEIKNKYKANPDIMTKDELKNLTDVHKRSASIFFGIPVEKVSKEQRQDAKNFVFGVMYGMGDNSIANNLGKDVKEAKKIRDLFFKNMPEAADFLFKKTIDFSTKNLYVESPLGRRRRVWGYLFPKGHVHAKMDRYSMNSTIQGCCSDLNIIATSLLIEKIYEMGHGKYQVPDSKAFMVINLVHDSSEMEIPKKLFKLIPDIEKNFTKGVTEYVKEKFDFNIEIPLEVDMDCGKSLVSMNKWDGSKKSLSEIKEKLTEV